jgi:hypothetical protein
VSDALVELIEGLARQHSVESCRRWAAIMLARDLRLAESILEGRPVLVRRLDRAALVRAMRGEPIPSGDTWLYVEASMLDAISEGGPFK